MERADLHIHSSFSDSTLACEDIFSQAAQQSLRCISVVDHDSMDFYFSDEYARLSKEYSLEVIKGVELSAQYEGIELHVLGYFSDVDISRDFLDVLDKIKKDRAQRIARMIENISSLGIKISLDEFMEFAKSSSLSRLHLAAFVKHKKIIKGIREAFSKYIGTDKPAYVKRFHYDLPEAIAFLRQSGALAFLAHPLDISVSKYIDDFVSFGLSGLEVFYPSYTKEATEFLKTTAKERGLLMSGGSDAHGEHKRSTVGCVEYSYRHVEDIKDAFRRILH